MTGPTRRIPPARLVFSPEDRVRVLELIDESLLSGSLTLGRHTEALEAAFRGRHGAPFALAVSSGTAALEIIFRSLRLSGAEVVVPTNTFFATAAAVIHAGGIPRFADVDPATLALSVETVEAAMTPATAAVVLVHIGGLITPEIDTIRDLCERRGVLLIEDAAHAHGSSHRGRPAGSFSRAAAFSFYPTKVITAAEGGVIVTADEQLAELVRIFRDQGKAGFFGGDHVELGAAWRMSELHAAVAQVQLARLDEFIDRRRRVGAIYDQGLEVIDGITPLSVPAECVTNYYKYIALVDHGVDRTELKSVLRDRFGVSMSGEVYPKPLHRQPIFAGIDNRPFPVAEDVCERHVCLPVFSDMTDDEAFYVLESLAGALRLLRSEPSGSAAGA